MREDHATDEGDISHRKSIARHEIPLAQDVVEIVHRQQHFLPLALAPLGILIFFNVGSKPDVA
jgi:hypothetical protein